jgi:hypothetical protein
MSLRIRPLAARSTLLAAIAAGALCGFVAVALANVYNDMNDWNLTTSATSYGGGTQYHIGTSSDGRVTFRWLDSPDRTTVISSTACSDGSMLGSTTIGAGGTGYQQTFVGYLGQCFTMRGRTTDGTMSNHDGRVNR